MDKLHHFLNIIDRASAGARAAYPLAPLPPVDPPPVVDPPPPVVDPPAPPPVVVPDDAWTYGLEDAHVVEDARVGEPLERVLQRLRQRAPSPQPGTVLAVRCPMGTWPGLGVASGSVHSDTFIPGWWEGCELRLVGPEVESGPPAVSLDPGRYIGGGDTVALLNQDGKGLKAGKLALYGIDLRLAGRAALMAASGSRIAVDLVQSQLSESPAAVAAGGGIKWGIQAYLCSLSMYDVLAHLPNSLEHVAYTHGSGYLPMRFIDVVITAAGGQALQFTERESEVPNSAPVEVLIESMSARGFHRNSGRAGSALTFAGAGVRAIVRNSVLIGGVDGGLPQGLIATWTPDEDLQSYAEEDPAQLGYGNVSLLVEGCHLEVAGNGNREIMHLSDCADVEFRDNVLDGDKRVMVGYGPRGLGRFRWHRNVAINPQQGIDIIGEHAYRSVESDIDLHAAGPLPVPGQ